MTTSSYLEYFSGILRYGSLSNSTPGGLRLQLVQPALVSNGELVRRSSVPLHGTCVLRRGTCFQLRLPPSLPVRDGLVACPAGGGGRLAILPSTDKIGQHGDDSSAGDGSDSDPGLGAGAQAVPAQVLRCLLSLPCFGRSGSPRC